MVKSYFKGIKNVLLENINRAEEEIVVAVAWWVKLKERTKIVAGLVEFLSLIIMVAT